MNLEQLRQYSGEKQLKEYRKIKTEFNWHEAEQVFSWAKTGRMNMAYEAIDRHAHTYRKNKIALYFRDEQREEKYTFKEMKDWTNKAGHILKQFGHVQKGDRVFLYLPRIPELYFSIIGTIKLGAIVGALFEAFKVGAVKERLKDSGAKVLITTTEMFEKLSLEDLPALKTVFLVGEDVVEHGPIVDFNKRLS